MSNQLQLHFDWVSFGGMLGTWVIAALAIWGDRIRAALFKPTLKQVLLSSGGELTKQSFKEGDRYYELDARYFHLRVTNASWTPAHDVQVLLTAVEKPAPDGSPERIYTGAIPLVWRHPQLYGVTRTVGSKTEADADLFFLRADRLQLLLMLVPNNLDNTYQGETHIWVTTIARGVDGESAPLRLKIDWDGKWERGDAEIRQHLKIASVSVA